MYTVPTKAVFPDLVELAGGPTAVVARAQDWFDQGDEVKALRLLDVAKASGPESRQALRLRLTILKRMLARSVAGHDNASETGILRVGIARMHTALENEKE